MIVVIDYGVGNLASIRNMLRKAGANSVISNDPRVISKAEKLLLPGVGHFDHGMESLNSSGLRDVLDKRVLEYKTPILGICLGAQILGKSSAEGKEAGLGWINMHCEKLAVLPPFKVPHMGWNQITPHKQHSILSSLENESRFYFVHTYCMRCTDEQDVLASCNYGKNFTCAVQKDNIIGLQFHPEKSLRHGLSVLRSFLEI